MLCSHCWMKNLRANSNTGEIGISQGRHREYLEEENGKRWTLKGLYVAEDVEYS